MWNRVLTEGLIISVQTVILIGLCATIGVSGSDRKAAAEIHRPAVVGLVPARSRRQPACAEEGQARPLNVSRCGERRLWGFPWSLSGRVSGGR